MRSYAQLVEYLLAKHADIRAVELDFDGRNILLYYLPQDVTALVDPAEPLQKITRGVATAAIWRNIA